MQDTVARTFSNELGQALEATVVVENRAGAGGTIGAAQVARAAPDGLTLIVAAASHNLAGHMYSKLSYDPVKDFAAVALLAPTARSLGRRVVAGLDQWSQGVARRRADERLWDLARRDPRVLADLQAAASRAEAQG